jgi:hypothetical protein
VRYRASESEFVYFGRPCEAAQLSEELKRRFTDLLICSGRFEVIQSFKCFDAIQKKFMFKGLSARPQTLAATVFRNRAQEGRKGRG